MSGGVWMLVALAALVLGTGLPVWALLVGVASASALLGVMLGVFEPAVLAAMPTRLLGLLEQDLLQALPLYVFIGVLLQRVSLADAWYAGAGRLTPRWSSPHAGGVLAVGVLIAPMNGSVAAGASLLSRLVGPAWARHGTAEAGPAPARVLALVAVAATLGVVVPPSLVLLLLGDALMRAHTEAQALPGAQAVGQLINTRDLLHAALLPAVGLLVAWTAVAFWQMRRPPVAGVASDSASASVAPPLPRRTQALAFLGALGVAALLGSVYTGRMMAVEAAATGGVVLCLGTLVGRGLDRAGWQAVCHDTLELSGALLALLMGATTFSLVFRLWGTDAWLSQWVVQAPGPSWAVAAGVLAGVGLCAWVLDAFEMIFVIIPLVAPGLIARLGDAQQAGVLLLLILQASFLWPPMGYAVLLARSQGPWRQVRAGALWRSLAPYLLAQAVCLVGVFVWPACVHGLDDAPAAAINPDEVLSNFPSPARYEEPAAQPSGLEPPASAASVP